jgi:hypothetical protein
VPEQTIKDAITKIGFEVVSGLEWWSNGVLEYCQQKQPWRLSSNGKEYDRLLNIF